MYDRSFDIDISYLSYGGRTGIGSIGNAYYMYRRYIAVLSTAVRAINAGAMLPL